jgi:hypothetical protein
MNTQVNPSDSGPAWYARSGIALFALLLTAWALRLAVALPFPSIHWPDEIYQVLEHAHRWVFGYGIQSWDWSYGIRSVVPPALFTPFFWLARELGLGPGFYMPLIRAALCAWSLVIVWTAFRIGDSWQRGLVIAAPAALWCEMLLFAPHPLLDSLAAPLLVLGIYQLTRDGVRHLLWAGLCLGVAFCLRPALAPAMVLAALLTIRRDLNDWSRLIAGGVIALALYGLADLSVGRPPLAAVLEYARLGASFIGTWAGNALSRESAAAASAGSQPWHVLIDVLMLHWGSALPFLLLLIIAGARGNRVWLVAALAVFATYSLIPQREYRYVYPALACLMIPMGVGLQRVVDAVERLDLAPAGTAPRLAVLVLAFCSLLAARAPGMADEWRHGSVGLAALTDVGKGPALCGLGLSPDVQVTFLGGYTVLHRNVPIYDGVKDLARHAAYYSDILTARPRSDLPKSYTLVSCRNGGYADWSNATSSICHYRRSGTCVAPDATGPTPIIPPSDTRPKR